MGASWQDVWQHINGLARFGMQPGLERMEELLERLGHPERRFASIQVAGTNGKGATAFALASLLQGSGKRCALFTSPHVLHASERLRVDGLDLAEEELAGAWEELRPHLDAVRPSYFEVLVALALVAFARAKVDFAVWECGLGGRLDATSVVRPQLSLLTSVGEDHLAILGPTLADVARDKAHVAPAGGILLSAVVETELALVVEEVARSRGAQVLPAHLGPSVMELPAQAKGGVVLALEAGGPRLRLPVDTRSWREAATLALQALFLLQEEFTKLAPVDFALDPARWPGRFQVLSTQPPRVLDVAHNPPALARLVEELERHFPGQRFHVLLAGMADKDLAGNLRVLVPVMEACRVLVVEGHMRAAGQDAWEGVVHPLSCPLDFVDRARVERMKSAVALGDNEVDEWAQRPLLVCGSFLAVSAWLGQGDLPPGL